MTISISKLKFLSFLSQEKRGANVLMMALTPFIFGMVIRLYIKGEYNEKK